MVAFALSGNGSSRQQAVGRSPDESTTSRTNRLDCPVTARLINKKAASCYNRSLMHDLKKLIREVPDFPKPGILFYDITTLLKDRAGLAGVIDGLKDHYKDCLLYTSRSIATTANTAARDATTFARTSAF